MNLDKAIETVTSIKHVCRGLLPPEEQAALSLSIEAMKDKLEARRHGHAYSSRLLPGETED